MRKLPSMPPMVMPRRYAPALGPSKNLPRFLLHRRGLVFWLLALIAFSLISTTALAQSPPACVSNTANYPCVYVANSGDGTVSVISAATNAMIGKTTQFPAFPPPPGFAAVPSGLAITPDNAFVYVALSHYGATVLGAVGVIATKTGIPLNFTIPLQSAPSQVSISPDGAFVWVAEPDCDGCVPGVQVIATSTNKVVQTILDLTNPTAIAISPDGKHAYVADTCSKLACVEVIDTSMLDKGVISYVNIPNSKPLTDGSIAVTPDGSLVCVSFTGISAGEFGVAFVNPVTQEVNPVSAGALAVPSDFGIGITPSGGLYAAAPIPPGTFDAPILLNSLYVFDATTESFIGTITVGSGPTGVAVSPDGKSVYVTNSHTGTAKDPGTVSIIQSGVLVATPVVGINPQGVAVMPSVPPTVITQPADQVVGVGNPATLTVQAAGSPPLAYQWYQGQSGDTTAPVAGATGSSFTTPALSVNITYWVQVINVAGNVNSNTATVTVASLPVCSVLNLQAAGGSPYAVAATAMCSDQLPLNTTLDWGDGTETSVSGGSIATSHTYPQQPPGTNSYNLQVKATNSLQVSGFKNGRLDLDPVLKQPVVVFQGQTASLPPVTLTSPNKQTFTVNFSCTTVVDSSNNPRPASQLGITCEALSQPITFTCTRTVCTSTPVTILIHTTGGATASLTPYGGSRSIFYAYLLPVAGVVFVFGGAFSGRRRRRLLGIFVLFSLQVMLGILTSCGGGFTTPKIVQNVTPAGTYRLTVVDNPVTSNDPAFEQTTLIVPLTVVPYQ